MKGVVPSVAVLLSAACGSEETGVREGFDTSFPLTLRVEGEVLEGESRVMPVALPANAADWFLDESRSRLGSARTGDGRTVPALYMSRGKTRLTITGPFEPFSFNRLRVAVRSRKGASIRAEVLGSGRRLVARSGWIPSTPDTRGDPALGVLDLPGLGAWAVAVRRIVLEVESKSPVHILGIERILDPLGMFVAGTAEDPELMRVAGDSRRGSALRSGRPRSARFPLATQ